MSNLKLIETQKTRVHTSVVETLERALVEARAGRLTGVAIAACTVDEAAWTGYSACLNRVLVIGAMDLVRHRMLEGLVRAE